MLPLASGTLYSLFFAAAASQVVTAASNDRNGLLDLSEAAQQILVFHQQSNDALREAQKEEAEAGRQQHVASSRHSAHRRLHTTAGGHASSEEGAEEEEAMVAAAEALMMVEHPFIVFARSIYSWLVPCMVAILLMAVLGNGLIVVSSPWLSGEASHYNWLCVSLAGADAWAASLLISGLILNSYVPVVLKIAWDGKCVAALLEIFRIAGMLTSNLHILALAANQFLGICHPLLYKTTITTELVRWLILVLWLIPIAFVGAWFVAIPGDSLFASVGCRYEFYTRLPFRLYIFIAFAAILLLTIAIYAHILVYLLRQKARYRLRRNSVLYSYRRRVQSKMKLLTTTLLILSTFTLSWGVCVLYFVLVCRNGCPFIYLESISFQTGLLLNSSVNLLVALKLVLNPLIYALRMCHIRKSVAELFGAAIAIRSRSLSSQLLTLRPMSRQLSSPRPFTSKIEDHHCHHNHHQQQQQQQQPHQCKRTQSLSDPPSRGEAGCSGSSRELLTPPTTGR